MTRDVTTEGQWYDSDTGDHGPTYPYTDSLVTAHRVLAGDRISPPAPTSKPNSRRSRPPRRSPSAITANSSSPSPKRSPTPSTATPSAAPCPPAPASSSPLTSRSATPCSPGSDHSGPGAQLWTHIARRLRGPPRAEALTVAAVCYCLSATHSGRHRHPHRARGSPSHRDPAAAVGAHAPDRAARGPTTAADPPRPHRRPPHAITPRQLPGPASTAPRRVGRAPFFFRFRWRRRALRDRRPATWRWPKSVAPHPF